jgi:hypothetical protein
MIFLYFKRTLHLGSIILLKINHKAHKLRFPVKNT